MQAFGAFYQTLDIDNFDVIFMELVSMKLKRSN